MPFLLIFFLTFFHQNPTLEHYTSYKASDLKTAVLALQDLQLNTDCCPLSAIRMKYRHGKVSNQICPAKEIRNLLWFISDIICIIAYEEPKYQTHYKNHVNGAFHDVLQVLLL